MVPGEFYAAATRPPAVYRGNPFAIEVGLAYGGVSTAQKVSREALHELLEASDARTLRQFLSTTFDGVGAEAADKILDEAALRPPPFAGQAEGGRNRQAPRGHAQRQPARRPVDDALALCQPRAPAIPGRRPAPSPRR